MAERRPKKRHRVLKITGLCVLVFTISVIVFMVSYILGIDGWQDFDPTEIEQNMELSLRIYDRDGELYTTIFANENRVYAEIEDMPDHLKNAFIAIEDTRFYEHNGIDPTRIIGALWEDIKSGSIKQGASTISQQLIKTSHLTYDQTMSRKLAEIMMAFKLEQVYTKDEILELYLNQVYFGKGAYGVGTAAMVYFGKDVSELNLSESAALAGILKSPSNYAPHINMDQCIQRRNLVLSEMYENGFITEDEYNAAKAAKLSIVDYDASAYPYGFYTDMVQKDACELLGISYAELQTGGYQVYTTLDQDSQAILEELAEDSSLFPENAADGSITECAAVILDPQTGGISAILGGREHTTRLAFNRATSMRRQPGSAIKPVMVFAPAIEYGGYSTTSFLLDQPENFGGYAPRNSGSTYRGWLTLRDVVAYSVNIPTVRLLNELTVAKCKSYASSVGIPFEEKDKNLSLALGGFTTGVTPLELCGSYMPFASGGYYTSPYCIAKIVDRDGNVVYEADAERYNVLSPETSYLVSSMLTSSVEYGTSKRAAIEGIPLAAKTGTSTYDDATNNKDAWIVSYNSQYIVCCWMGFDKTDDEHSLPQGVTGGTYPADFSAKVFSALYDGKEGTDFQIPPGIAAVEIDQQYLDSYYEVRLASPSTPEDQRVTEYFTLANLPTQSAEYITVSPPENLSAAVDQFGYLSISFSSQQGLTYQVYRQSNGSAVLVGTLEGTGSMVSLQDYEADISTAQLYEVTVSASAGSPAASGSSSSASATVIYTPLEGAGPSEARSPRREKQHPQ